MALTDEELKKLDEEFKAISNNAYRLAEEIKALRLKFKKEEKDEE